MGKVVSFVLALSTLGLLALLVFAPTRDLPRDAGLLLGSLALAVLAWVVAFTSALYRALLRGASFQPTLTLLAFFWLPALPALIYGLSGLRGLGVAMREKGGRPAPRTAPVPVAVPAPIMPVARPRRRFTLPPVDRRLSAASRNMRGRSRGAAA